MKNVLKLLGCFDYSDHPIMETLISLCDFEASTCHSEKAVKNVQKQGN